MVHISILGVHEKVTWDLKPLEGFGGLEMELKGQ
jgi:hypothetical protein